MNDGEYFTINNNVWLIFYLLVIEQINTENLSSLTDNFQEYIVVGKINSKNEHENEHVYSFDKINSNGMLLSLFI